MHGKEDVNSFLITLLTITIQLSKNGLLKILHLFRAFIPSMKRETNRRDSLRDEINAKKRIVPANCTLHFLIKNYRNVSIRREFRKSMSEWLNIM